MRIRTCVAFFITAQCALTGALSQTLGTKLWQFTAGGEIRSSPAVAPDGTIYFGARDNKLYALNSDGSEQWAFTTGGWVDASPAVGPDGTIYAGSKDGQLYAVSTNGMQRWSFPTQGSITEPVAVAADGTVYLTSSDGALYALAGNGAKKWQFTTGYDAAAPSVATDGTVYVGAFNATKSLYSVCAVNPDGSLKWSFPFSGYSTGPMVGCASAIDLDGTVYPGGSFTVSLTPDGLQKAKSGSWSASQPMAIGIGSRLYISREGGLVASTPDGTVVWPVSYGSGLSLSQPTPVAVSADGTLYVGEGASSSPVGSKLHALNASDGTEKWSFQTSGQIYGAPTIGTNGVVYVGATDQNLYALQGSAGPAPSGWPQYRHDARHTGAAAPPTYTETQLGVGVYAGIMIPGNLGSTYRIEYAESVGGGATWSLLGNVTLDRTPYLYFDAGSKGSTHRFYRAILLP